MKHQYKIIVLSLFILTCVALPQKNETEIAEQEEEAIEIDELADYVYLPVGDLPVTKFKEIWGYVIAGQEAALKRNMAITDVGYFGAEVSTYGALTSVPNRRNLSAFNGRVHLVVTCGSYALTYFSLMPGSPQRKELIADLIEATQNYDGLNIDYEYIPQRSGEAFLSFLRELRAGLPKDKIFSIALKARTRTIANDVYDYEKIKPIVDKIFIMAYDEHWSTSGAGPVASMRWCKSVAEYSYKVIGQEKLIMGIPFYGRAWVSQNHHRALVYSTTERLINTYSVKDIKRENGIPTFDYNANISVKVYYEDEYSVSAHMEMYKAMNIDAVGFWRIGQETPGVWGIMQIEK
jgi:spore germination protein YaaH